MLHSLPWLLQPDLEAEETLKSCTGNCAEDIPVLTRLSHLAWGQVQLARLGRKFDKARTTAASGSQNPSGLVPFRLLILSSATLKHVVDALVATALRHGISLTCEIVEFERPEVWLSMHGPSLQAAPPNAILLAQDSQGLALQAPPGDVQTAIEAVELSVERLMAMAEQARAYTNGPVIVQTIAPLGDTAQASFDRWLPGSRNWLTQHFNTRLAEEVRERSLLLFDLAGLADLVGQDTWLPARYWYVAKYPFASDCVPLYAERLLRLIACLVGKSKRVLVLDLDNTLWGGVIGDDGLEGIVIGQGNARGDAHLAIQRMALEFKARGVILCIASKNTEEIALEAIRSHPDMLIRENDLIALAINWNDKAGNIRAMAEMLDLGLESFVFLDDNPVERKQVRDILPGISVPELPPDPSDWLPVFHAAGYFEQIAFSAEDLKRSYFYKGNVKRAELANSFDDHGDFLHSLDMKMTIGPFDTVGKGRIVQLISKTNQYNLTTRRRSEADIENMIGDARWATYQVRLEDMFGDNGMICVVICEAGSTTWNIDTWLMSCRVLGRGVEEAVLAIICSQARAAGARTLEGSYVPTAKNKLVCDHYQKLGFEQFGESEQDTTNWRLDIEAYQPKVSVIAIIDRFTQSQQMSDCETIGL